MVSSSGMNANKDEAVRCILIAKKRLEAGEREAARKFFLKAKRLYPSISTEGKSNDDNGFRFNIFG